MKADRYVLRQKVVSLARKEGIKAAVREFGCSRNTVRKWIRRYKPGKTASLQEHSKRPHCCPNQTSTAVERLVLKIRRQTGFGAERLKMEFDIPCGIDAIKRIVRQHGLVLPRKKKHLTKRCLREVKRNWKLFGQLCADTKHLYDIPHYWWQMKHLRLPVYQYTVREVVSGLTFTGYADDLSKTFSVLMAKQVCLHLAQAGVNLKSVEWQTDNGPEFKESSQERGMPSLVRSLGSGHHYIPPKAYTWQSDVETVHALQETEFFDRETYLSPADFWNKLTTYWLYFNIARLNRNKQWMSPLHIIQKQSAEISPQIVSWLPLDLGRLLNHYVPHSRPQRGHDLPVHPSLQSSPRLKACLHVCAGQFLF